MNQERIERKRIKFFEKQKLLRKSINLYGADIISSPNFLGSAKNVQHGSVSVKEHSIDVAKYSIELSNFLRIRCNERDLVRGALLHDYFLYDWHNEDYDNPHKLHGFYHPGTALRNASKEYDLTERQKDIISKHMWPLTLIPPACREAWIVTTADKYCSLKETLHIRKGHMNTNKEKKYINLPRSVRRV